MRRRLRVWTLLVVGAVASLANAQSTPVPKPLEPWVEWALAESPERLCASVSDHPVCAWPGRLALVLENAGGRFEQRVQVDQKELFALPGAPGRWPQSVRVDGKLAPVIEAEARPVVELAAGSHLIEGRFAWRSLPERLEVPPAIGMVSLRLDGSEVGFPKRDEQGQLWLAEGSRAAEQGEELDLTVVRKIDDDVPVRVTTRLKLRVSGRARELHLGRVLLEGTVPVSLQSTLPARLEADGSLRVQARAGVYPIEIEARTDASPEVLRFRSGGASWPETEVWVFQANEALRQVELSGAPGVDPARTELDQDWHGLPTFVLREGGALKLTTTRRGEPAPPPNRVTLQRTLWLDLDGRGYTVRDELGAELRQGFRLDLLEGELGHAAADGEDLLITKAERGGAGVELRKASQALVAEWRAPEAISELPAVGWSEDVQSLSATLHLGPGYTLLAARGVDTVSQTWLQDWDLFDFFFVLLVSIAVARLVGRASGLLALVTLALLHGEPDAPQALWVAWLVAIALLRVLPAGRLRSLTRLFYASSVVLMLVVAVPFAAAQLRVALFPQLEEQSLPHRMEVSLMQRTNFASPKAEESPDWLQSDSYSSGPARGGKLASSALRQDPEATVQTGPGLPSWQWRSWELSWSGPVKRGHRLQLYLIPPALNRGLAILRVALLAALLVLLLRAARAGREGPVGPSAPDSPMPSPTAGGAAAGLLLLALLLVVASLGTCPSRARAQEIPSQALLDQLRERLTKPAACRPNCVSIDELAIDVDPRGLTLTLSVHALERSSVQLPGPATTWVPASVALDGKPEAPVNLLEDGFLHVRVDPGVHQVVARGPLPPADTLTLALAARPRHASVRADGYSVDGVHEDGQVEGAIALSRTLVAGGEQTLDGSALPPWLALERRIELGPTLVVKSKLSRVTRTGQPLLVRVPLLAGESVTESAFEAQAGELPVAFGRDDEEMVWTSRLAPSPAIELRAATGRPFSETWSVLCGPIWHCELEGVTATERIVEGRYEPRFAPWPGEKLTVRVRRPEPAKGQSVTIEDAQLVVTPGVRMQKAVLTLRVLTSRGTTQHLTLPEGAQVQALNVDGSERPLRLAQGRLSFTLGPGEHTANVTWQEERGITTVHASPAVALGRAAANARVTLELPQDRWLLWASGPAWGPAILFWPYLVLVIGVALLLGQLATRLRVKGVMMVPLGSVQWMLLGLGLTQLPAPAALVIVGWFFAMAYRARAPELSRFLHNFMQLLLVGLSMLALGCLIGAVHSGLVMQPEMQVAGAGSHGSSLHWYVDRVQGSLPTPSVTSVSIWWWRALMLAWSLWLAASLVRWLPWAFACFRVGGGWRKAPPRALAPLHVPEPVAVPPVAAPAPPESPT